jgi:hypothetical protein
MATYPLGDFSFVGRIPACSCQGTVTWEGEFIPEDGYANLPPKYEPFDGGYIRVFAGANDDTTERDPVSPGVLVLTPTVTDANGRSIVLEPLYLNITMGGESGSSGSGGCDSSAQGLITALASGSMQVDYMSVWPVGGIGAYTAFDFNIPIGAENISFTYNELGGCYHLATNEIVGVGEDYSIIQKGEIGSGLIGVYNFTSNCSFPVELYSWSTGHIRTIMFNITLT